MQHKGKDIKPLGFPREAQQIILTCPSPDCQKMCLTNYQIKLGLDQRLDIKNRDSADIVDKDGSWDINVPNIKH